MLKDMYDERGILKPEYTMTESERKAQLFNNNKLILPDYMNEPQPKVDVQSLMIKEKLNKSLKQMQEDIEKIKNEKEEAVINQKFEKAAELRDKIKELEKLL